MSLMSTFSVGYNIAYNIYIYILMKTLNNEVRMSTSLTHIYYVYLRTIVLVN